jgi:hypothetical protein
VKDDAVIVSQHARLREHGESHRMGEKDGGLQEFFFFGLSVD